MVRGKQFVVYGMIGAVMVLVLWTMKELTRGVNLWPLLTWSVGDTFLAPVFGPEMQMVWICALVLAFILGARYLVVAVPFSAFHISSRFQRVAGTVVTGTGIALFLGLLTLGIGPWLIGGLVLMGIGLPLVTIGNRRLLAGAVTSGMGVGLTIGLLTMGIGPWLIGGLGTLFVGLALLMVSVMDAGRPSMQLAE